MGLAFALLEVWQPLAFQLGEQEFVLKLNQQTADSGGNRRTGLQMPEGHMMLSQESMFEMLILAVKGHL